MLRIFLAFIFISMLSSCQLVNFYLTTMMSEPTSVEISPPKTSPSPTYPSKTDLTILMYDQNNIYAYSGTDISKGKKYNNVFISKLLREKAAIAGTQLKIFIKEDKSVGYKSTVDILDQMTRNNIKQYFLTELNDNEKNFIKQIR